MAKYKRCAKCDTLFNAYGTDVLCPDCTRIAVMNAAGAKPAGTISSPYDQQPKDTMRPRDGGPAFPIPALFSPECGTLPSIPGMSLRDWFAGMALCGVHSNSAVDMNIEHTADLCYAQADAMLARRAK